MSPIRDSAAALPLTCLNALRHPATCKYASHLTTHRFASFRTLTRDAAGQARDDLAPAGTPFDEPDSLTERLRRDALMAGFRGDPETPAPRLPKPAHRPFPSSHSPRRRQVRLFSLTWVGVDGFHLLRGWR
jgi:hypothetical protein